MAFFKPTGRPSPAPCTQFEILVDVGPFCTIEETEAGPCSVLSRGEEKVRRECLFVRVLFF